MIMAAKPKDVTEAELAVLQALWDTAGATIRELTDAVYPGGGESDYATVKTLLARLESKGLVARDASEMAHRFSASVTRDDLIGRRLEELAHELCDGSATPLVMHLLKHRKFSARERRDLHDLLDKLLRAKSPGKTSPPTDRKE
jgi:predicted transcriptional regulator